MQKGQTLGSKKEKDEFIWAKERSEPEISMSWSTRLLSKIEVITPFSVKFCKEKDGYSVQGEVPASKSTQSGQSSAWNWVINLHPNGS